MKFGGKWFSKYPFSEQIGRLVCLPSDVAAKNHPASAENTAFLQPGLFLFC